MEEFPIKPEQCTELGVADTGGVLQHGLKDWLQLARRSADNLQHLRGRGPRDADAHYQLGAAVGLRASYTATVDGSVTGAFRAAREAYDAHERVLEIDGSRKDAGLIVGTYRYIVSSLALPMRLVAYVAGFGGGRERGLHLIEEAAGYPGDNQEDARFALVLLYNREKRYDDALKVLAQLRERYPGNRLTWLEAGSTYLRAGRPAEAERILNDGMTRFASDTRRRMFGEDALWLHKRGTARAALGKTAEAEADLRRALSVEGRNWVYGRTHLELESWRSRAGIEPPRATHFRRLSRCARVTTTRRRQTRRGGCSNEVEPRLSGRRLQV